MSTIKSETKVIRPFLGAYDIRSAFNSVAFHLGQSDPDPLKEVRHISNYTIEEEPYLSLNISDAELKKITKATSIDIKYLRLVAWATVDSAKKIFPLVSIKAPDISEQSELPISKKIIEYASRKGGVVVSVALVLSEELIEEPLRPSRYGQWLAKKDFKFISFDDDSSKIDIQELNDDVRARFAIPEGVAYFVDLSESAALAEPDGTLKESMTIYFESDSLHRLRRSSKSSEAVQVVLLSQIIPDLILSSLKTAEITSFVDIPDESPLSNFLRNIAKSTKLKPEEIFLAAATNQQRFKTLVQSDIQTVRALREMI
jgi:hypothetical protein